MSFLKVLEARKSKIKVLASSVSGANTLVADSHLLAESTRGLSSVRVCTERENKSSLVPLLF